MKLLFILIVAFGFQAFAAEIPVNTEAELKAASPELMKLLEQNNQAMDDNGEAININVKIKKASAKTESEGDDAELTE